MKTLRKLGVSALAVSAIFTLSIASSVSASTPLQQVVAVPTRMAALGDSISLAYNATSPFGSHPELSWSTGTNEEVDSISQKLTVFSGKPISTVNLSVPGTKMDAIPTQMTQAVGKDSGLITILSGANDACTATTEQMTSVHDYKKSFTQALDIAKENIPQATIVVGSVPDLSKLWAAGTGTQATSIWNFFKICQSVLAHPNSHDSSDNERRELVHERVNAYNAALREVCAAYTHCFYDNDALFNYEFTLADLSSLDFFHPSVLGQKKIAALLWPVLSWGDQTR